MLKQYSSTAKRFTIHVKIDGVQKPIDFLSRDTARKVVFFQTYDEDIQEQLEKSPDFGKYFQLDWEKDIEEEPKKDVEEDIEEEPKVEIPEREIKVKNVQDAKEYLNKKEGVPFSKLVSKDMVEKQAAQKGLTFIYG